MSAGIAKLAPPLTVWISMTERNANTMIARLLTPAIIAGAAAATVGFAPVAAASGETADCDARGAAALCQKTGYATVDAGPESTRAGNSAWPFAAEQRQPAWEFS